MQNVTSWKQHCRSLAPHSLVALFILFITTASKVEGQIYRIQNKLLDETQFSNPKSFDYNFEDDFKKLADRNDVYDELVPYLPTFILHKNGKNAGRTSVPIITRRIPGWSTPPPKQKYIEPYKPFSAKSSGGFQRSRLQMPTTLIVRPVSQRLTTRRGTTWTTTTRTTTTTIRSRAFLQQQQHEQRQRQQQRQLNIGLDGFTRRLSRPHSPLDGAVIGSKLVKQFNSKRNINSNTVIRSIQSHVLAKPLVIHTGSGPYLGPTFNCKVLTPKNDGRPSPVTDKTCVLEQPGISADGRCRCTYVVSDRDSNGCALGFLFTCLPK